MNVLDLYRADGFDPHRAGDEWQGPCPGCGCGTDRFCVREDANHKDGVARGWYHCGHGKDGNGCGKTGDNIQYLRDFRGLGYKEACDHLGITPENMQADAYKYSAPRLPRKKGPRSHAPKTWNHPPEVVDVPMWRQHGMKFVDASHNALLNRQKSLDWLAGRGIPLEMVKKFRLGLHLGKTRNGQEWETDFRPWPSWGLKNEKKANGRPRMIALPAGIVIPWITGGELRRIRIRLAKPNPQNPKEKYHVVKGSSVDLFYAGSLKARAFVLVETELDAVMIASECGNLVTAIGLGTVAAKPDTIIAPALRRSVRILNAIDFDDPGATASAWWEEQFPNCRRWPSPAGKDPGEAWQAGVDIREWISTGLPPSLVGPTVAQDDIRTAKRFAQQAMAPAGEVAELVDLLQASGGNVMISDHGATLKINTDSNWRAANQDQATRLTELVFMAPESAEYLSILPDGIYTSRNLVRRMAA